MYFVHDQGQMTRQNRPGYLHKSLSDGSDTYTVDRNWHAARRIQHICLAYHYPEGQKSDSLRGQRCAEAPIVEKKRIGERRKRICPSLVAKYLIQGAKVSRVERLLVSLIGRTGRMLSSMFFATGFASFFFATTFVSDDFGLVFAAGALSERLGSRVSARVGAAESWCASIQAAPVTMNIRVLSPHLRSFGRCAVQSPYDRNNVLIHRSSPVLLAKFFWVTQSTYPLSDNPYSSPGEFVRCSSSAFFLLLILSRIFALH